MNSVYIVQYHAGVAARYGEHAMAGIISAHFNEEDAEKVLLEINTEDDGEIAYVETWEVE